MTAAKAVRGAGSAAAMRHALYLSALGDRSAKRPLCANPFEFAIEQPVSWTTPQCQSAAVIAPPQAIGGEGARPAIAAIRESVGDPERFLSIDHQHHLGYRSLARRMSAGADDR
jgi:hypothetical protein